VNRASNIIFTILALTCIATAADAHTRSESYSHWYLSGSTITGTVTIPLREVMLLYQDADSNIPPRDLFRDVLTEHTIIMSENNPCTRQFVNILQAASGFIRVEMQFDCSPGIPSAIYYRALFDTAPGHVHYAKLHRDGILLAEQLITDTADTWDISDVDATSDSYSFTAFLTIGAKHITGGLDHIAFLLGLLLISGSIRRSIAAAVLGYVHADGQLVEAFIGFTVALVAVEYFLAQRQTVARYAFSSMALAWLIGAAALALDLLSTRALLAYLGIGLFAFCYLLAARELAQRGDARVSALLFVATTCFGLVHGFGFAGFLMETGILGTSLFVPLLGFNLGVELGQLILVVAALAAASLLRNRLPDSAAPMLAAGLCGIGIFWFVGRTFA